MGDMQFNGTPEEWDVLVKKNNTKQLTAVEWLQERLLLSLSDELKSLNGFFVIAKEMEKEQSQNYAIFAIRCDRTELRILEFNDYIKLEKNENK
jgi:hypothetical protein